MPRSANRVEKKGAVQWLSPEKVCGSQAKNIGNALLRVVFEYGSNKTVDSGARKNNSFLDWLREMKQRLLVISQVRTGFGGRLELKRYVCGPARPRWTTLKRMCKNLFKVFGETEKTLSRWPARSFRVVFQEPGCKSIFNNYENDAADSAFEHREDYRQNVFKSIRSDRKGKKNKKNIIVSK